jgi:hypothetical protein
VIVRPLKAALRAAWPVIDRPYRSAEKFVTDAVDRDDIGGITRCIFEFLTEFGDVVIHGPSEGKMMIAPHCIQQLIAGDGFTAPLDEVFQNVELPRRELEDAPGAQIEIVSNSTASNLIDSSFRFTAIT